MKKDLESLIRSLADPAVQLLPVGSASPSYLGGPATLPASVDWPRRGGRPLSFLARIDLGELAVVQRFPWLPHAGALHFFYDALTMPWGLTSTDADGWAVAWGNGPEVGPSINPGPIVPHLSFGMRRFLSLPSSERGALRSANLSDVDEDDLLDLKDAPYGDHPRFQIGGYPFNVQGDDMEFKCDLLSRGFSLGSSDVYRQHRPDDTSVAAWKLLLQVESVSELNMTWADHGTLYYWIHESDGRRGDFSKVRLFLQSN